MTIAKIVSAFGSLHANFLTGPRVPYAMARDGYFFAFARRIQPVFHTPDGALIFQGSIAALLVLTGTYEELYSFEIFAICCWVSWLRPRPRSVTVWPAWSSTARQRYPRPTSIFGSSPIPW